MKVKDTLRLSGFSQESFVDGPGIRVVVFVQGCDNACAHCHNPESWDINGGEEYTIREVIKKIKDAAGASRKRKLYTTAGLSPSAASKTALQRNKKLGSQSEVKGVTFSGGEPFMQAGALVKVAQAARRIGLDITVYSGHTYEELSASPDGDIQDLLALADYLIDGPYIHERRDIGLKFRGSANQRVIDMNATRKAGQVVLF